MVQTIPELIASQACLLTCLFSGLVTDASRKLHWNLSDQIVFANESEFNIDTSFHGTERVIKRFDDSLMFEGYKLNPLSNW